MGLILQKYENMPNGPHAGAITTHCQQRLRMAETSENIFTYLLLPSPFRK